MKANLLRRVRIAKATVLVGLAMLLTVLLAGVLGAASTAEAHRADRGLFHLNHSNTVQAVSRLMGSVAGPILRIDNNSAGLGATALDLQVEPGKPPMTVNSSVKVDNLNTDQLDGKDQSAFLGAGAKAADSELLDGKDSTEFVQGSGEADHGESAMSPGSGLTNFFKTQDPDLSISYSCPSSLTQNGTLRIQNNGSAEVNLFSDNGSGNPSYRQLAPGASFDEGANAGGELITFGVHNFNGAHRVTTIEVFTVHRSNLNNCHVQAQSLITR